MKYTLDIYKGKELKNHIEELDEAKIYKELASIYLQKINKFAFKSKEKHQYNDYEITLYYRTSTDDDTPHIYKYKFTDIRL